MLQLRTSPSLVTILTLLVLSSAGINAQQSVRPRFQFPVTGSRWVPLASPVIIRPGGELDPAIVLSGSLVTVTGSASGPHAGRVAIADDRRTLVFTPARSFAANEVVTVAVGAGLRDIGGGLLAPWSFTFGTSLSSTPPAIPPGAMSEFATASPAINHASGAGLSVAGDSGATANHYSPDDFPRVTITGSDNPTDGLLYLSNLVFNTALDNTVYLMVLDNAGVPAFSRRLDGQAFDFKRQADGRMTYGSRDAGQFYALDTNYNVVDSFKCGGGHDVDIHDLQLLPNGHALMIGADPQIVDMSAIVPGGNPKAIVIGLLLQELDSSHNVVFEWRTFDHFAITDAAHEDLTAATIDYVHTNSIQIDTDGNILMSSRHLDEVTKIDRTSGDILWRLGGKNNQFRFVNDSIGFSHQHAARRIANGHLTLFDNGNFHTPAFSRAVEYDIDEVAKTATLVWQYRHTPDIYGEAMGYVQRLDNGNTLISWGATDVAATEVRPDGGIAFEMKLPPGIFSYRVYRFPGASRKSVSLVAPANGAPGIGANPDLQWNPAPGATAYEVQIASDSSFTNDVIDDELAATHRSLTELAPNAAYYWRARPRFGSVDGDWSDVWTFSTSLAAVIPVMPINGADHQPATPTFGWLRVAGRPQYHVQIAIDSAFNTIVADDSLLLPYGAFGLLDNGTTYYWRVRWENDSVAGLWSEPWSFTTDAPLSAEHAAAAIAGGSWLRTEHIDRREGTLTMRYFVPAAGHAQLALFDERGARVATLLDAAVAPGEALAHADIRGVAAGRYFCRLTTDAGMVVEKIVVER